MENDTNIKLNEKNELSSTCTEELRPAQKFGQRLREASSNPVVLYWIHQQYLKNRDREIDDLIDTESSRTLYRKK